MYSYVNEKNETISGMGKGRCDRGGEFNCDVRTFVNVTMYSQQIVKQNIRF
jgi:hypothetical protein